MAGGDEKRDRSIIEKGGRHDNKVEQVPGPEPGIVGHEHVPGSHLRDREAREKVFHCAGHRVDMSRSAGHGLRDHAPPEIADPSGEVARFTDDRAKCRSQDRLCLLLDDRNQPVPHHLLVNCVHGLALHGERPIHGAALAMRCMTMYREELISARKLAGTKVDVSSSAMIAGPAISAPGSISMRE